LIIYGYSVGLIFDCLSYKAVSLIEGSSLTLNDSKFISSRSR
jgi:hypothetical protein